MIRYMFVYMRVATPISMSDQDHDNFMNKVVSVPALLGKSQNFPMADTFFPGSRLPALLQINPVCFCKSFSKLNPFVSLFGDLNCCMTNAASS